MSGAGRRRWPGLLWALLFIVGPLVVRSVSVPVPHALAWATSIVSSAGAVVWRALR